MSLLEVIVFALIGTKLILFGIFGYFSNDAFMLFGIKFYPVISVLEVDSTSSVILCLLVSKFKKKVCGYTETIEKYGTNKQGYNKITTENSKRKRRANTMDDNRQHNRM